MSVGSACLRVMQFCGVPFSLETALKGEIQRCGEAQPRWDTVWAKALAAEQLVSPARRPFYHAHVLTMIAIDRESNRALQLIAEGSEALDEIFKVEAGAEYGKRKNWYRGDWLTGIHRTRELVHIFVKRLENPSSPIPPPSYWTGWEAYYHIMHYQGNDPLL